MVGGGLISQAMSSGDRVLGQGLIASAMCTYLNARKEFDFEIHTWFYMAVDVNTKKNIGTYSKNFQNDEFIRDNYCVASYVLFDDKDEVIKVTADSVYTLTQIKYTRLKMITYAATQIPVVIYLYLYKDGSEAEPYLIVQCPISMNDTFINDYIEVHGQYEYIFKIPKWCSKYTVNILYRHLICETICEQDFSDPYDFKNVDLSSFDIGSFSISLSKAETTYSPGTVLGSKITLYVDGEKFITQYPINWMRFEGGDQETAPPYLLMTGVLKQKLKTGITSYGYQYFNSTWSGLKIYWQSGITIDKWIPTQSFDEMSGAWNGYLNYWCHTKGEYQVYGNEPEVRERNWANDSRLNIGASFQFVKFLPKSGPPSSFYYNSKGHNRSSWEAFKPTEESTGNIGTNYHRRYNNAIVEVIKSNGKVNQWLPYVAGSNAIYPNLNKYDYYGWECKTEIYSCKSDRANIAGGAFIAELRGAYGDNVSAVDRTLLNTPSVDDDRGAWHWVPNPGVWWYDGNTVLSKNSPDVRCYKYEDIEKSNGVIWRCLATSCLPYVNKEFYIKYEPQRNNRFNNWDGTLPDGFFSY